jgi:hypothetical protein
MLDGETPILEKETADAHFCVYNHISLFVVFVFSVNLFRKKG